MYKYSNVEVISLDKQQIKNQEEKKSVLNIEKVSAQSYSITVQCGNIFVLSSTN